MRRLPPYLFGELNRIKHARRQEGFDIIDLGMGNPTDPPPKQVIDKLCESARELTVHGYSASIGIPNLRREVAKHYRHYWDVSLEADSEVICTIGSKEGFSHLCLALMGPGDTALVPTPAFPIHVYSAVIAGANVIGISMSEGEEVLLANIAHMAENLYPKPKVLILNYPHNPTTATVELDFYEQVVWLAKRYGFAVIHDFAYGLTTFEGYRAPSFMQAKGAKDVGVELSTMSKPYSMAGWRMGFCVGNPDILKCLGMIKGYYDYGLFTPIQVAGIIALRQCHEDVARQAGVYEKRRDALIDGLSRIGWPAEKPKASMFCWVPLPEKYRAMGSMEFCKLLLDHAEVAVSPGVGFGEDGEGFVRVALVENEKRMQQAVRQIKRALREYDGGLEEPGTKKRKPRGKKRDRRKKPR